MHRLAAAFLVVLAFATFAAEPIAVVPRSHPDVAKMEEVYGRYVKASKAGNKPALQAAMSQRASAALQGVRPELIAQMTRDDLDPKEARFARGELRSSAGRLVYWQDFGEEVRWQGLVFVKEKDGWRIDRVVSAVDKKTRTPDNRLQSNPSALEGMLANPQMQLPSP